MSDKECKICKISKKNADFFLNDRVCFSCIYEIKLLINGTHKKKCKLCDNEVADDRVCYCSQECADKAKLENLNWTQKINYDSKGWENRFNFSTKILRNPNFDLDDRWP